MGVFRFMGIMRPIGWLLLCKMTGKSYKTNTKIENSAIILLKAVEFCFHRNTLLV